MANFLRNKKDGVSNVIQNDALQINVSTSGRKKSDAKKHGELKDGDYVQVVLQG